MKPQYLEVVSTVPIPQSPGVPRLSKRRGWCLSVDNISVDNISRLALSIFLLPLSDVAKGDLRIALVKSVTLGAFFATRNSLTCLLTT